MLYRHTIVVSMFLAVLIVGAHLIPDMTVVSATGFSLPDGEGALGQAATRASLVEKKVVADSDVAVSESTALLVISKETSEGGSYNVRSVPFYSQFYDISAPQWRKVGCGIASLAMLIAYYEPESVNVDTLLQEGIEANAFLSDAGWTHAGLISLAHKYGLSGASHDLSGSSMAVAFGTLEEELEKGPVMASVHYTFDPKNTIPHLVVINAVSDGKVFYNDPSEKKGGGSISITQFQSAWKKRYIDIRPIS